MQRHEIATATYGESLAQARDMAHMTQHYLARRVREEHGQDVRLTQATLSGWESQEHVPTMRGYLAVWETLGYTLYAEKKGDLISGEVDQSSAGVRVSDDDADDSGAA